MNDDVSRRTFLGAAATLSALPATTQSTAGQEEPNDGGEEKYPQEKPKSEH